MRRRRFPFLTLFQPDMKTFTRTFFIALLLSFFPLLTNAAVLERVTSQRLADGKDVVNLLFQGRSEPKIFSLDGGSPRLVFDFSDVRYLGPGNIAVNGAVVKAVRIAMHQNPLKTRVVFDLIPGHNVDYNQDFLKDSQTLQITLSDKNRTPAVQPLTPEGAGAVTSAAQPAPPQSPGKPETATPMPVKPPTPEEIAPPQKTEAPAQPEVKPVATPEKSAETASSPFDRPLLAEERPTEPSGSIAPDETASPVAVRLFGYSLTTQPAGGDMLRLQLDGYASPQISKRESDKPQLVCFFPQMRLAMKKGLNQHLSGKFVQKVVVSAQKKPVGVRMVIDLEGGYDYNIQQVFVQDESAFVLSVNVVEP